MKLIYRGEWFIVNEFADEIELIPLDKEKVYELIWRPIQKALLRKESTTNLSKSEVNKVFETVSKLLAERFGIVVEFPSIERI